VSAEPAVSAAGEPPIFSERLSTVLENMFKGEAPNVGRFCSRCYTPIDHERVECRHCGASSKQPPPVERVPDEVLLMFRRLRRRESLVVNGFAYAGLALGVLIFIAIFYVLFSTDANVWWYIFDIILLFVGARVLAGLLGGVLGDELGFKYARRKLTEDWQAYEAGQGAGSDA